MYALAGEVTSDSDPEVIYYKDTYKLDLTTLVWEKLVLETTYAHRYLTGSAIIGDKLALLPGWSNEIGNDVEGIATLDLTNVVGWVDETLSDSCYNVSSFAYASSGDIMYIFSGYNYDIGNLNIMLRIDNWNCEVLSENSDNPSARMYHSMVTMNGKLYMYGGQGLEGILEDMWVFDISTEIWEVLSFDGISPGARFGHAVASEGDVMVIWGGQSSSGYLNDMYQYGAYDKVWKKIESSGSVPSAKKGACMAMKLPYIYIFGGESTSGKSSEIWVYDTGLNVYTELIPLSTDSPPAVVNPTCEMYGDDFMVIFGTSDGEFPETFIYYFNVTTYKWEYLYNEDFSLFSRSLAVVKHLEDTILVIGGQAWSTDPYIDAFLLDLNSGSRDYLVTLPEYYYGGAFSMYGTRLYIFGGGSVIGKNVG